MGGRVAMVMAGQQNEREKRNLVYDETCVLTGGSVWMWEEEGRKGRGCI